jgi:hypothetical protein
MMRPIFISAALTGAFCAVFAVGVDLLTDMLGRGQLVLVSFISGSLGSLFAQGVRGLWQRR